MKRPIFLLSDFGRKDYYVAAMKTVILSINIDASIIDITHDVNKWDIVEGGFILWQITPYLPSGAIVVGVVDPGVGSGRKNIIIETENYYFVGPDNGLLYPAAERDGILKVYEINLKESYYKNISNTFHGRDIYAPTAAYLSIGITPDELGYKINLDSIVKEAWPKPKIMEDKILGHILYVDGFGNLISSIPCEILSKENIRKRRLSIRLENKKIHVRRVKTFTELEPGEIGLICGSSNLIEIVCNRDRADKIMGLKPGDELFILFR